MDKRETYGLWAERIDKAENLRDTQSIVWNRHLRFYRQDLLEEEAPKTDSVWINYQFGLARSILPSIYFKNPDVIVLPRGETRFAYADVLSDLLNYQIEQIDFETEMRKVIFDTLFCGFGVMKFGFAPQLRQADSSDTAVPEESVESLYGAAEPTPENFEPEQSVTDDLPFAIRIPPRLFYIDPLATSIKNARWVIHAVMKSVDDFTKTTLYPHSLVSGVQGTHSLRAEHQIQIDPTGSHTMDPDNELVIVYEIWDLQHRKLYVMDSYNKDFGAREFLKEMDWPYPDLKGFPFEILTFNMDPDTVEGISDASTWENPANAINLINSMQYNHVKRFHRKYVARRGIFTGLEEELTKLQNPLDGAIVEINGEVNVDLQPLVDAPMTMDAYTLRDNLRRELTFISGLTEQRKGDSDAKTATEASIIENQARVRDSDRLYLVSMFVQEAASKLLSLDRAYLDRNYVAFIVGLAKSALWTTSADEILQSEVDVKVRVGSSGYISREVKTKQMLDFLNLTASLVDPMTGMPVVNIRELIRRVADMMDLEDYESLLMPPPMPPPPGSAPPGQEPGLEQQQGGGWQQGGGPGMQEPELRTGAPNLGNMLSGVQNLGVRRTPPNPTTMNS